MPTLKQLTCTLEWTPTNTPIPEHGTAYADGYVSTYIAIPASHAPTPFSVHLISNGYIAPGLAMFVFMDGVYQCNRNRCGLAAVEEQAGGERGRRRRKMEVDFRVRQKEVGRGEGEFEGRAWRFERVKVGGF